MGLFSKLIKAGSLTASSVSEGVKTNVLKIKIKRLKKKNDEKSLDEKNFLEYRLKDIKALENGRRERIKAQLKSDIKKTREKRAEEVKGLNTVVRVKKEFRSLPVISAADDIIFGISGLETMEKIIRENPEDPFAWLLLAETLRYHRKAFLTVQGLKLPVDFIGSIIDVGSEYIGDFIEKIVDDDKLTFEKSLGKSLALVQNKAHPTGTDYIIAGRCMQLFGDSMKDRERSSALYMEAEKYYKRAVEAGITSLDAGETYYYLFEICNNLRKYNEHIKYLEQSKDNGFLPAQRELSKYSIAKDISIPKGIKPVNRFRYSIRKSTAEAVISGTANVINKQSEKVLKTGERIVDSVLSKIIK